MQLLGLLLLIASSWYIFQLSSKFLDDPTKKEIRNGFNLFKEELKTFQNKFSKDNLRKIWEKYKEEGKVLEDKDK